MKRNRWGIHGPNHDPTNLESLLGLGFDNFVVVDKWEQVAFIRDRNPNAIILLRPYFEHGMNRGPTALAHWACDFLAPYMQYSKHVVIGNELNIEGPFDQNRPDEWRRMNDWVLATVRVVRSRLPEAIIHFPAISPGIGDDPNVMSPPGLEYCRAAIDACDILDQHCYWPIIKWEERFRPWFGRRMLWHHRLFPNKYIFISEAGPTDNRPAGTADDLIEWFRIIENEFPYCLGGNLYMWNWGPSAPMFNYHDKPELLARLRAAPKRLFEVPDSWVYDGNPPDNPSGDFEEWYRNYGWNHCPWGEIPYNPNAALPKAARAAGLGVPLAPEERFARNGKAWAGQRFALGFAYCEVGDWGNVRVAKY